MVIGSVTNGPMIPGGSTQQNRVGTNSTSTGRIQSSPSVLTDGNEFGPSYFVVDSGSPTFNRNTASISPGQTSA